MSHTKQLGAEAMFKQSLIYLYNSFREQGLSQKEAKEKVSLYIEKVYREYAQKSLITSKSTPMEQKLIQRVEKELEQLKRQTTGIQQKQVEGILSSVTQIKRLLTE